MKIKILCLQLARLGDIYQTWPTLSALRRKHPCADIHFLVRERFSDAAVGLQSVDKVLQLKTQDILEPYLRMNPNPATAMKRLEEFLEPLKNEKYDFIVNLSFSPFSSFLVDYLAGPNTVIAGYSRHRDGFFNTADDASSYFYSQVGVERSNRIHITDLFALVAGVELTPADFKGPNLKFEIERPEKYIVIHIGASDTKKSCDSQTWRSLIDKTLSLYQGEIVIVGAKHEESLISDWPAHPRILNKLGAYQLAEIFELLKASEAVLGCDSVVMHMASLVNTPSLNLSFSTVKFWETGPRADISRILWFDDTTGVEVDRVVDELMLIINRQPSSALTIEKTEPSGVLYTLKGYTEDNFSWELTRALYMEAPFPRAERANVLAGFARLFELSNLGLEQLHLIEQNPSQRDMAISILNEVDHLIDVVGQLARDVQPVVRWFQGEKLRIGPENFSTVIDKTKKVFSKLKDISEVYCIQNSLTGELNEGDMNWKL